MGRSLVLAWIVVLGCAPQAQHANESGSRIRMRVGTTSDGARIFLGWHDAARHEDCEFVKAIDSRKRCLPTGAMNVYYREAGCKTPNGYTPKPPCPDTSPPRYAIASDHTCAPTGQVVLARVFPISSLLNVSPGTTIFVRDADGACTPATTSLAFQYFDLGAEIAATAFQEMSDAVE